MRREFVRLLFLSMWFILSSVCQTIFAQNPRPNFLIIVSDDQRYDGFNNEYMPLTSAALAGEGVTFERAYVTTPFCCPSRATILTGMYASQHDVLNNDMPLLFRTAVDALHSTGYYTGMVGKYLNSWDGTPRPEFSYWVSQGELSYLDPLLNVNGNWSVIPGYNTYILRDYALDFLRKVPADKPFFLLFAPNAPHRPAEPAPEDRSLYSDLAPYRPPNYNEEDVSDKPVWLQNTPQLTQEQRDLIDLLRKRQLRTLKSLDQSVWEVLDLLRYQGKLDQTLIIYLSDNGFLWGEHRMWEKNVIYEPAIRVPFVLRYPPLVRGPRVETRLVANIDIAPTIYQLAGLAIPHSVLGRSLVQLFNSTPLWPDAVMIEAWTEFKTQAIHNGRYVYIETVRNTSRSGDLPELYDLERDPDQLQNVVNEPQNRQMVQDLRRRLNQERSEVATRKAKYKIPRERQTPRGR